MGERLESGPVFVIVADNTAASLIFTALNASASRTKQPVFAKMTRDLAMMHDSVLALQRPYGLLAFVAEDDFSSEIADSIVYEVADKIRSGNRLNIEI